MRWKRGRFNFGNKNLRIGASRTDANIDIFKGKMDDFRIYDRALSGAEIELLINVDKPTFDFERGLIAYYPFNGNANDKSGNGNDGELKRRYFFLLTVLANQIVRFSLKWQEVMLILTEKVQSSKTVGLLYLFGSKENFSTKIPTQ